jgi:hypothetical protein
MIHCLRPLLLLFIAGEVDNVDSIQPITVSFGAKIGGSEAGDGAASIGLSAGPAVDTANADGAETVVVTARTASGVKKNFAGKDVHATNANSIENAVLLCSTMRKRRAKMNKHKLKKRRKKLRMNTKVSRGK